jgi:DNA-binding phage protein
MNKEYIQQLLDKGFNCFPINKDKTPTISWKNYQDTKIISIDSFNKITGYYALVCGFQDVECIDIDLKIIKDYDKRKQLKNEIFSMFDDNIENFYQKVVVKKTINEGYHVIYKSKNIEGNSKLAKLKECSEALIETRGVGGYICMYEQIINERDYHNIDYITDEERDILMLCCKSFNEPDDKDIKNVDHKTEKKFVDLSITPWADYNNKNNIWDLICNEFTIKKKISDRIIIKRHGAKSPHSGYIFTNSGCMYLFSSGTIYPANELITPFKIYAIKNHNSDFSKAASVLYSEGYGSRKKPEQLNPKIIIDRQLPTTDISFPIDIFPENFKTYILASSHTLNNSVDFMGVALLWLSSLIIGNSIRLEVKRGWQEISTLWIAIVGDPGVGKSPALDSVLFPLLALNKKEILKYKIEKEKYDKYNELTKKEKEQQPEQLEKPQRTQFIVDDVTIEALINLHSQSKNGVGIYKDELAGWFKDMNKYKEGSDKEQWLSSWSGKGITVDRITRQSDYIDKPILPVLGGIQPAILSDFFTDENKENGFLDRMLFSFPDLKVEKYVDKEIDKDLIRYYNEWIIYFYQEVQKTISLDEDGCIKPIIIHFADDAKKEWIRIFNEITKLQNSDETNEFLKSILPKQKSYICRFSMIINILDMIYNERNSPNITKESILKAEKLSKYFIEMNRKIILYNTEVKETNDTFRNTKGDVSEKIKAIYNQNPNFNKAEIAKKIGISRTTLYNYLKQFKN